MPSIAWVDNDWSKSPNGEDYRQRHNDKGRSGLLSWLDNWAGGRVEKIQKKWRSKIEVRESATKAE
jgi:hypothetical protein